MSKFLNERQIGFDSTHIGFPNLGDCMSMVLQDTGGLFGFHLTRGDLKSAPAFVSYVQDHRNYSGNLTHMYAACHRKRRYGQGGGLSNWKAEMQDIAEAIKYSGNVSGFDLAKSSAKVGEAIFMEFRLAGGVCSVWYKGMGKMTETTGERTAPDDNVRELVTDMDAKKRLFQQGRGAEWDNYNQIRKISPTLGHAHTTGLTLTTTTRGNKGELHAATKLDSFTV